jgi:hypothetical protein
MKELEHLTQFERIEVKLDLIHANQKGSLEVLRWLLAIFAVLLALAKSAFGFIMALACISLTVAVEEFLLLYWKRQIINKYKEVKNG